MGQESGTDGLSDLERKLVKLSRTRPGSAKALAKLLETMDADQTADEAEERLVELLRELGRDAFEGWAERQDRLCGERLQSEDPSARPGSKKKR